MLFSGLRSAEVSGLAVDDVNIALGWVRVLGKGEKQRRVPVDREVCGLVQSYVLSERPGARAGRHPTVLYGEGGTKIEPRCCLAAHQGASRQALPGAAWCRLAVVESSEMGQRQSATKTDVNPRHDPVREGTDALLQGTSVERSRPV